MSQKVAQISRSHQDSLHAGVGGRLLHQLVDPERGNQKDRSFYGTRRRNDDDEHVGRADCKDVGLSQLRHRYGRQFDVEFRFVVPSKVGVGRGGEGIYKLVAFVQW